MSRSDQSKSTVSDEKRSVLSVKLGSIFLVGLLLVGTIPVTHSYPSAKADINNIWLAAKEFWGSLELFKAQQLPEENIAALDPIDAINVDTISEVLNQGLEKLKTHPECRSIYVSEYLPTFNSHVIEKCEKAIKQHEQKRMFDIYVKQLCTNIGDSALDRDQLGEVQLRLRKYSLTFPQSDISINESQIDGLYGKQTCEAVANYQIISKFDSIDGIADEYLYTILSNAIPLSEDDLASLSWQENKKPVVVAKMEVSEEKIAVAKPNFKLPVNPFKRISFCMRNNHIKQCKNSLQGIDLAKANYNRK